MADTLKFTVTVSADQATEALRAISAAASQAGVSMKTSLVGVGGATKQATNGLVEMKKSAGQARETMMFLTQSLTRLGPEGQALQQVMVGIGGALLGGGGLVAGLAAAQIAGTAIYDVWTADARAAEEFRKRSDDLAKQIAGDTAKTTQAILKAQYVLAGGRAATFDLAQGPREAVAQYNKINSELFFINEKLADKRYWDSQSQVFGARERDQLKERKAILEGLVAQARALVDLKVREAEAGAAVTGAEAEKKAVDELIATRGELEGFYGALKSFRETAWGWTSQDLPMPTPEQWAGIKEGQSNYEKSVRQSIATQQEWGQTIGQAFSQLVTGQASAEQIIASIGQQIVQQTVQAAIAQITTNAAVTGSEAAKSQAGIPVVGPVLAISAMGAMISSVLGLISTLPSARGGWWDTGSYEGLAMIHEREMVLPAREAEMVRRGAGGVTLNVAAYDARGFDRVLSNNSSALAREMRRLQRRGKA